MASAQNDLTLEAALASFDKTSIQSHLSEGAKERKQITDRFPLDSWPTLPLEKYALGVEHFRETYCYLIEYGSRHLGSIRGGSARKLLIYKASDGGRWYFDPQYKDEQTAWKAIRQAFVEAFEQAKAGQWKTIDEIDALQGGPALRVKTLHIYFPDQILAIAARDHLVHFLQRLGSPAADDRQAGVIDLNRALLSAVREVATFNGWTTNEIERFLYWWTDPRERARVVKISPGKDATFWDECLAGEYICVGWDEVGDLRNFDSKESFKVRFSEKYLEEYNNNASTASQKANELWTLSEMESGDIIVANKGASQILAIGTVVEPGYEWLEERSEFKHIVHVHWDTSYAKDIPPQKRWPFVTVAPVSAALYEVITGKVTTTTVTMPFDLPFDEIAAAIARKGQVILYGPPGTGKTFVARRFAVSWLSRQLGKPAQEATLADPKLFDRAERELSTVQVDRRTWWVVANPKEWSWDKLFKDKRVSYRYGRLKKNYPLVQEGDLVIGYQAGADKKIAAVGRILKAFTTTGKDAPHIEIGPVRPVIDGPTFKQLSEDPIVKNSEPIRFNNQGTLFALTAEEADHLLGLLADKDSNLESQIEDEGGIGPLTRLTFHPSYSYEDFIEGFRPVDTGSNTISLRLEDGVFKRICREAQGRPGKPFLVLIDEINRANLAKVFGEIITLIENDKRGMSITLPQSKESFSVPPNVYILGTMNTADRSIKLLDAALRRRFAFVELMPDLELLHGAKIGALPLDTFLQELNSRIASHEGREKQIGHAVLLEGGQPVADQAEFARRFRQEILPLLQEYCYDDYAELAKYVGTKIVDAQTNTLNDELLADADQLLTALEEEFTPRKEPQ